MRFKINREAGSIDKYYDESESNLPDKGAGIEFFFSSINELNIHFGYTSPAGKKYERDINIGVDEIEQLRDYLNTCLTIEKKCIQKFAIFDPYVNLDFLTSLGLSFIGNIEAIGAIKLFQIDNQIISQFISQEKYQIESYFSENDIQSAPSIVFGKLYTISKDQFSKLKHLLEFKHNVEFSELNINYRETNNIEFSNDCVTFVPHTKYLNKPYRINENERDHLINIFRKNQYKQSFIDDVQEKFQSETQVIRGWIYDNENKIIGTIKCPCCHELLYMGTEISAYCEYCDISINLSENGKLTGEIIECPYCGQTNYYEDKSETLKIECKECVDSFTIVPHTNLLIGITTICSICKKSNYHDDKSDVGGEFPCEQCGEDYTLINE